jgi:hypothetical protein
MELRPFKLRMLSHILNMDWKQIYSRLERIAQAAVFAP